MATIVTRIGKGSALTFEEGDANFTNLNTDKLEDITGESIGDLSDVDISSNTDGNVLTFNSSTGNLELQAPSGGIANLVEDTTPQLGGNLDGQGNSVSDVQLENYKETIYDLGVTDTPTVDVANGNVQKVAIATDLTLNSLQNVEAGQSVTLLIAGPPDTVFNSTNFLFANGDNSLSLQNIATIFYDGTTYFCSIAKEFQ